MGWLALKLEILQDGSSIHTHEPDQAETTVQDGRYSNMNNTETRQYVDITASFIDNEMPKVHPAFRSPRFDEQRAQYKPPPAFKILEEMLREHFQSKYGIKGQDYSLDEVLARINTAGEHYTGGLSKVQKGWLFLGNKAESLKAWLEFLPEEYGLNIVKAGFGVILEMAQESAKNRDQIIETFRRVNDMVSEIEINTTSLNWDKLVRESALDLFGAIADIIIELLKLGPKLVQQDSDGSSSPKSRSSMFSSKSLKMTKSNRREKPSGNLDELLATTEGKAARLQSFVGSRRDKTIMDTHKLTLEGNRQVSEIRYNTKNIEIHARTIGQDVKETGSKVERISETLYRTEADVKHISEAVDQQATELRRITDYFERYEDMFRTKTASLPPEELKFLMDEKQQYQDLKSFAELFTKQARGSMYTLLVDQIKKEISSNIRRPSSSALRRNRNTESTLPLEGFIMLLASREDPETRETISYDIKSVLAQPHRDIKSILSRVEDFDTRSQSQAQSIVQKERFLMWMSNNESDILLVDGNLHSSASDNLSAMSLFNATFAISMASIRTEDVFVHFFCGLHTSARDWFYGPSGLVRSLIIQLLRALDQRGDPNLNFINSKRYVRRLKMHDLDTLCIAVEELINQFPIGTSIYCIIDGISVYDKDYQGLFEGMKIVLGRLQDIIQNDNLELNFKVLCTTPGRSTKRVKQLVHSECRLDLTSNNLNIGQISEYSLRVNLPPPSPMSRPRTPNSIWEQEDYSERRGSRWD
ncbi:hypothetical protein EYR41_006644 [Orbilia oligospora]|uniref:Fungal STAND N-terminal Goodbye domain-containing protein n=2 Tax=Orbilia oligospora TaxID=2813651 RepID=A0A8H2HQ33_ORBOL|nr:hypothetical protein EYR41_006644 [Orbilia oligospora]